MAGLNRKRGTYCAWCGEPMWQSATLVRVARVADGGWSFMPCHRGECAETYASVMRDNGWTVEVPKAHT